MRNKTNTKILFPLSMLFPPPLYYIDTNGYPRPSTIKRASIYISYMSQFLLISHIRQINRKNIKNTSYLLYPCEIIFIDWTWTIFGKKFCFELQRPWAPEVRHGRARMAVQTRDVAERRRLLVRRRHRRASRRSPRSTPTLVSTPTEPTLPHLILVNSVTAHFLDLATWRSTNRYLEFFFSFSKFSRLFRLWVGIFEHLSNWIDRWILHSL